MQVFDLTQLLDVTAPPVIFGEADAMQYNGFGNAHNIVINESTGYTYAVGTSTCRPSSLRITSRSWAPVSHSSWTVPTGTPSSVSTRHAGRPSPARPLRAG